VVRARGWRTIGGAVGYAVSCLLAVTVLAVAGYAHYVERQVGGLASSNVDTGGPQTGAMNILLMGLESRTDYNGNVLPAGLLAAMHAGSVNGVLHKGVGGQATNTLILIHIFAGGQKAVGFSIPRDDLVTFPQPYDGESQGKIDQAYGLAWAQSLSQTNNSKISKNQRYLQANEAGQSAAIDTIQALTGVHVDHFAEVNLAGFYELAHQFGGIEACLKSWSNGQNLHDTNSGFNAPHAGYLHLDAAQSLAFVRERDNLPHGDLDRTHRQQAVLDYVIWKLKNEGILTSIGQLTSLINVAKKFVITDQGWQIFGFASDMKSLTGKSLTFKTAPVITTDGHMAGQTVNLIDPAQVRTFVQDTFYPPTATAQPTPTESSLAPGGTTVDVLNGGAAMGLARQMSQALTEAGYQAGEIGNTAAHTATQVVYGAGGQASANKIAGSFRGVTATASPSVPAGHVQLILGPDAISVPPGLGTATATPAVSATPSASSSTINGGAGGTVSVKANAPYGIPCVY
jgi:LCP family protein required for cell wall assembly